MSYPKFCFTRTPKEYFSICKVYLSTPAVRPLKYSNAVKRSCHKCFRHGKNDFRCSLTPGSDRDCAEKNVTNVFSPSAIHGFS